MGDFGRTLCGTLFVCALTIGCDGEPAPAPATKPSANDSTEAIRLGRAHDVMGFDDLVDRARRGFHMEGSGFRANAETFDATLVENKMTLTPIDHHDVGLTVGSPFTIQTEHIAIGQTSLTSTPQMHTEPGGDVVVDYGTVIERFTPGIDGLEQSWKVLKAPKAPGAFVVTVAATGHELVAQTPTGLHFASSSEALGFSYGHGLWIDANGMEYEVPSTWVNGRIVLSVPEQVIARSAFPAVLDPVISAERAVDTPVAGPSGASSGSPSVAFSGSQFLVVWRDSRSGRSDIYGTRVSNTGAILDTGALAINAAAGTQDNPTVAFANGEYVVVWEDYKSPAADPDLAAARVTTTGTVTQLGYIGATTAAETKPRLGQRGTEALLVFERGGSDVVAARYSGGAFGSAFDVAATLDTENAPNVAANPAGDYLVTFSQGATDANLRGQLVTSAGALNGASFDISAAEGAQTQGAAAFANGNFIVVWANGEVDIYGTRVSTTGVALDTRLQSGLPVGGIPLVANITQELSPTIGCLATSCLVAWQDRRNFETLGYDVYSQTFNTDLTPATTAAAVSAAVRYQSTPNAVAASNRYMVVWEDDRDLVEYVYGARVSTANVLQDPNGILLARGNNRQIAPFVARGSANWLTGWSDSRVVGNNIMGVRVSNAVQTLDTTALAISNAPDWQDTPAGAFSGLASMDFLVAWSDRRGADYDIYAARVTSAGSILDSTGFAVSTANRSQLVPDLASNEQGLFLLVWQDLRGTDFDIYGALVNSNGSIVVPEFAINNVAGDQSRPHVAYDPVANLFLVVWHGAPNGSINGARVTPAGVVLDPTGVALSASAGGRHRAQLAFAGDRFLVAWDDRRNGNPDIYATRVSIRNGITVEDPNGIAIATLPSRQTDPTVAGLANGNAFSFVVAWTDERNLATARSDIYGVVLAASTGGQVGAEFAIAGSTDDESVPAFAHGSTVISNAAASLIAYQRFVSTNGTQRVFVRRVTESSNACQLVCPGTCVGDVCTLSCSQGGPCDCPPGVSCGVDCSAPGACSGPVDCTGATSCDVTCSGTNTCQGPITCGDGDCNVSCTGSGSCTGAITCGGGACNITCTFADSCPAPIDCGNSTSCLVRCSGDFTCDSEITCGAGPCDVRCSGAQSCASGTTCNQSCACDVTCNGVGSCADPALCPNGATCTVGNGCSSTAAACDTCP